MRSIRSFAVEWKQKSGKDRLRVRTKRHRLGFAERTEAEDMAGGRSVAATENSGRTETNPAHHWAYRDTDLGTLQYGPRICVGFRARVCRSSHDRSSDETFQIHVVM